MKNEIKQGILLDVRTVEEYAQGHFAESRSIPLANLVEADLDVTSEIPIFIHCQMGGRAEQARQILLDRGYQKVTNLGGLEDVQALGLSFVKE